MLYLSGVEHGALREAAARGYPVGLMAQPRSALAAHLGHYPAWAADNGCYAHPERFRADGYLGWLSGLPHRGRCLFAAAPDVPRDAAATRARSAPVLPLLRRLGYPAALVAQDGMEAMRVDWGAFDVLFLGGSTGWKLSAAAYGLAAEARARGKRVHQGRCNSLRRLAAAAFAGCESADGTFLRYAPDNNVPRLLRWLDALRRQPFLA